MTVVCPPAPDAIYQAGVPHCDHAPGGQEAHEQSLLDFGAPALLQRYEPLEVRGAGAFGKVYRARDRNSFAQVALKRLRPFEDLDEAEGVPSRVLREVSVLRDFVHPNVVRLLEVYRGESSDIVLVFEFLDIDLHVYMKKLREDHQQMPFEQMKRYSNDLAQGVHACHIRLIVHRDLKPQNVLVGKEGLKICDFGLARVFSMPLKQYTHDVVTLWYRAPEILLGTQVYGPEVDVWSLGCIIAELATTSPLFSGDSEISLIFKIFRFLGTPSVSSWPGVSQLAHWHETFPRWESTHLQPLLHERPELGEVGINLLNSMLSVNPRSRIKSRRMANHAFFTA